jgi:hypothetical protein
MQACVCVCVYLWHVCVRVRVPVASPVASRSTRSNRSWALDLVAASHCVQSVREPFSKKEGSKPHPGVNQQI